MKNSLGFPESTNLSDQEQFLKRYWISFGSMRDSKFQLTYYLTELLRKERNQSMNDLETIQLLAYNNLFSWNLRYSLEYRVVVDIIDTEFHAFFDDIEEVEKITSGEKSYSPEWEEVYDQIDRDNFEIGESERVDETPDVHLEDFAPRKELVDEFGFWKTEVYPSIDKEGVN